MFNFYNKSTHIPRSLTFTKYKYKYNINIFKKKSIKIDCN